MPRPQGRRMESAGSPVWPPASFLLKMAKSSCLVCVCHCASVGGGGRGGGACLLSWDLEWVGTFLWIPFGLSTLTSEVSDFLPGAFLSFPPSPPPLFHLSPSGSYCLAPNQLDAATLGSAALAREQCLRSWHCGKPKAAKHAHDRHLAADREGGAHRQAGHQAELCAGGWRETRPSRARCFGTPANPN